MKTPQAAAAPLIRMLLSIAVLLAGVGLIYVAGRSAGTVGDAVRQVLDGTWSAPVFAPFVAGVLCIIYGAVGLLFRRDDSEER